MRPGRRSRFKRLATKRFPEKWTGKEGLGGRGKTRPLAPCESLISSEGLGKKKIRGERKKRMRNAGL